MMKDVYGLSRHIDPPTYRYFVQTNCIYTDDIVIYIFAYSYFIVRLF